MQPSTLQPSQYPTDSPVLTSTDRPTPTSSLFPTSSPSKISKPSPTPSLLPTQLDANTSLAPTSVPSTSGRPTYFPTVSFSPTVTGNPTVNPTFRPSQTPSISIRPTTFAPTSASPVISFSTNLTLSGLPNPFLDEKDKIAIVNATAITMKIYPRFVSIVKEIATPVSTAAKIITNIRRRLAVTYSMVVITKVAIPTEAYGIKNSQAFYEEITRLLTSAVTSGEFTSTLRAIALASGANNTAVASVTNITSSPPTVIGGFIPTSSSAQKSFEWTIGVIVGVAIGGVAFLLLLFTCCYLYYHYSRTSPKLIGFRKNSKPIIRHASTQDFFDIYPEKESNIKSSTNSPASALRLNSFRFSGINPLTPTKSPTTYFTEDEKNDNPNEKSDLSLPILESDTVFEMGTNWSKEINQPTDFDIFSLEDIDLFYDENAGEENSLHGEDGQSLWSKQPDCQGSEKEVFDFELEQQQSSFSIVDRGELTRSKSMEEKTSNKMDSMENLLGRWEAEQGEEPDSVELGHDIADIMSFSARVVDPIPLQPLFSTDIETHTGISISKPETNIRKPISVERQLATKTVDQPVTQNVHGNPTVASKSPSKGIQIPWSSIKPFNFSPTKQSSKQFYLDIMQNESEETETIVMKNQNNSSAQDDEVFNVYRL